MKSLSIPICQTHPSITPKVVHRYVPSIPSIDLGTDRELLLFLGPLLVLAFLPKGPSFGLSIAGGTRGTSVHSVIQGDEVFVGSEGVLNGEVGGVIPVEGALRVVVTVSATAPAVGERFLDVGHSGIGGVVLNPAELVARDEEVAAIAISEVVENRGIASMEFAVSIHLLKDCYGLCR